MSAFPFDKTADGPTQIKGSAHPLLWCPECDRQTPHTIRGRVAECVKCMEPHEIDPETLKPN